MSTNPPRPYPQGMGSLAVIDDWCHRHNRHGGKGWHHPLGMAFWLLYRPLCNYYDRSLFR